MNTILTDDEIDALELCSATKADVQDIVAAVLAKLAQQEPVRRQCVVCDTVYEDEVPPQVAAAPEAPAQAMTIADAANHFPDGPFGPPVLSEVGVFRNTLRLSFDRPNAPAQASAVDDDYKGWYCAHCQRGVDASEVTFREQHETCGRVITDDRPPKTQASAVDERAAITEEDAYEMGAKGAEPTERERKLFEAWMRGHCWALSAHWDGRQYVSDAEQDGDVDPRAVATRRLWAAWRDRAALAQKDGAA